MLTPGTHLGPYEVEAPLGAGGVGEVYRARDTRLGRAVAIKVLSAASADVAGLRERLEREARAISQLSHPHICTLFDIGSSTGPSGNAFSFLVMELIDGETLEQVLTRGPLAFDQVLAWSTQIAEALAYAHRHGIVHGDLKPGNVMITKSGVKLLDFGLARERSTPIVASADDVTRTTTVGPPAQVTGTLQYLAPEQLEGRPVDERGDLFACGAVFYEMATGRKAFEGKTPAAVIAAILRYDPPPIRVIRKEAPPALDRLVDACLVKDPDERWQNAGDLARELRWLVSVTEEAPVSTFGGYRALLAAVAVLLLTVVGLGVWEWTRPAPVVPSLLRSSLLLPEGLQLAAGNLGGVGRFAISPDGRRLAFVATDANGNQLLWLRTLDSLAAAPLSGTDGASSPFWSPNSQSIAFVAQGQLKVVTLPGGTPRVVASPAFNATGSWHGETILFSPGSTAIYQVSEAGGTPRPVTTLDTNAGDVIHRNPFFLPDGNHFLYVAVASRAGGTTPRAVYVGSLADDGADRLLMESGSSAKYANGQLLFLRENTLVAQPFDPDSLTLSGDAQPIAEGVELSGPASATFNVSDGGVLVYQTTSTTGSQLTWVDRQGRQIGTVGERARYGDLELSPDGRQAAVSLLDPATNTRDLWTVDVERGVRTRLTRGNADEVAPVWSPDGTHIAFASNRAGRFDIYRTLTSGIGAEELVVQDEGDKYPASWSTSGDTLLLWAFGAARTAGLVTVSMSGEANPVAFLRAGATQASFSPDGKWVAYISAESGRPEVYAVSYPTPSRRVQLSIAGGNLPRWSHDGSTVFYAARDNRLMAVGVRANGADLEAETATPLFEVRPVGRGNFYAPTADGNRFLINASRDGGTASSLTIVQNWTAALEP